MASGKLKKVEIKDEIDAKTKIKREFFLTKDLYNKIVDWTKEEESSFSYWVNDACRKKANNIVQEIK